MDFSLFSSPFFDLSKPFSRSAINQKGVEGEEKEARTLS